MRRMLRLWPSPFVFVAGAAPSDLWCGTPSDAAAFIAALLPCWRPDDMFVVRRGAVVAAGSFRRCAAAACGARG